MTVLSDVVQQVVAELGFGVTGVATGGSTTTLIDTKLLDRYSENYFDEGTLLVVYDAGGASAAPQGEWGVVSNFNNQNNTVTINAALTTAIAAGDVYVLASARFQLYEIIDAVNRATKETGDVETVNSSNTVVAAQLEYTLPAATTTVTKVEYNTIVGDANWLGLEEITGWEVRKAASGSAGTLVLPYLPPVGRTLYITYTGKHPARFTAAGVIDDRIDLAALALRSAIILVERKLHQPDPDPQIKAQLDTLRERYAEVRSLQEPAPQRQVRLFTHHLNSAASTRTKWWSN